MEIIIGIIALVGIVYFIQNKKEEQLGCLFEFR